MRPKAKSAPLPGSAPTTGPGAPPRRDGAPVANARHDAQARWQRCNRFTWDKGGSRGGR